MNDNLVVVQYHNPYLNQWLDFMPLRPDNIMSHEDILSQASKFMDNNKTRIIQRVIDERVISE